MLRDGAVKILAASDYVIARAHRSLAVDQFAQKTLACFERQRARVETIETQQIEDVVADRDRKTEASYLPRVVDVHPSLQELETRAPVLVLRDDLAIQHEAIERDRIQREYYFWISISNVGAFARVQVSILAFANSQNAHAVVLDFE